MYQSKFSDFQNLAKEEIDQLLKLNQIYKYVDLETGIDKILSPRSLQFTNPKDLNDPFEANTDLIDLHIDDAGLDYLLKNTEHKLTRQERRRAIDIYKNVDLRTKFLEDEKDKYKISCFSKVKDEVLMWSHYADKHNGICIGFKFPIIYKDQFILSPVKYLDALITVAATAKTNTALRYWLTAKSQRWFYEAEIRAIRNSDKSTKNDYVTFDHDNIKEVIFGCNVSDLEISESVKKLSDNNYNIKNIKFSKMKINKKNFLLEEVSITPY